MSRKNTAEASENGAVNNITAASRKSEKVEKRIYVGPSLKGITRGTVFQGGLSSALEEMIVSQ